MEIRKKIKNKILFKLEQYLNIILKKREDQAKKKLINSVKVFGANSFFWGNKHVITGGENLIIGENVHINNNCYIRAEGQVQIGDNTHISRNFLLYSINHDFEGNALPYDNNIVKKKVIIGKNVWIGMNVCITPGTVIGDGAIIGMGTVVSGVVPALSIVGGAKWRVIGQRDLESYEYLEENKKYGGINGNLYKIDYNEVLLEVNKKVITKRGTIELIYVEDIKKVQKKFDPVLNGKISFENEKLAISVFSQYSWFPKSEIFENAIITEYFDSERRVDFLIDKLTPLELESLKAQIIFALIDIYKCGYSHRDIHQKNMFFTNGNLKIIDYETLIKRTQQTSFFDSYDIVARGEVSPFATNYTCFFSDFQYSINKLFAFKSIEDLKSYIQTIMFDEMIDVSNTFFTRKNEQEGRHKLKRKLIYNTFDLKETQVDERNGQRNIEKRIKRFNIKAADISGKKILDLGSNIGGILLGLSKYDYKSALGLEYDLQKVELSNTIAAINSVNNVLFKQCDLESNDFFEVVSEVYDVVFCLAVIEHLRDKETLLKRLHTITKEKLFLEGNANTDINNLISSLKNVGFSKVDCLGLSDDEFYPENNNRPLFIAYP